MRTILNFIGTGGAFSKKNTNNSAYYLTRDKLILFDCGETVFHQILKLGIISKNINSVDIIITHFHSDHAGSLGSLVFYCRFKGIKSVNIIFPVKKIVNSLLKIFGVSQDLFNVKKPSEIKEYYLKEYEQIHGDVDKFGNIIPMPSYGYHLINDNDNFFYSGDTCVIHDIILEKFKNKKIKFMYQEVTDDGYKAHVQIENLVKLIEPQNRKRVICMHLGDNFDIDKIKKLGFNCVR